VIDLGARKLIDSVDFGRDVRSHYAVFGPKDSLVPIENLIRSEIGDYGTFDITVTPTLQGM
jgi:hypothetical protein